MLSSLLEKPGPKSLEFHLARLFQAGNQRNDLRRALHHAYRAKSNNTPDPCLFCSNLLMEMERRNDAIEILKEGINRFPSKIHVVHLYMKCIQLLIEAGKNAEAINILEKGILLLPADKAVIVLYDRAARLCMQIGHFDRAIALLKHGVENIPISEKRAVLFARYSEVLYKNHKIGDAINLLNEAIEQIPSGQKPFRVYDNYAKFLLIDGQREKAIDFLFALISINIISTPFIELLLSCYSASRDKEKLFSFIETINVTNTQFAVLAKILLYQINEQWIEAAEYAKQMRVRGHTYHMLSELEAFSWLCGNQPERALSAISNNLKDEDKRYSYWVEAFIQLRLGDIEKAKIAYSIFNDVNIDDIDESLLLKLWDQPSAALELFDLASHFPIMPSSLTGLPNTISRIPYSPPILNSYREPKMHSTDDLKKFDVFLCHNSDDKPFVNIISNELKKNCVVTWLDEEQLSPGKPWQVELEKQINSIASAAVFLGKNGLGPWQKNEIRAFLTEFANRGCPVIPVILPDAEAVPQLPIFLKQMTSVDLRNDYQNGLERLRKAVI